MRSMTGRGHNQLRLGAALAAILAIALVAVVFVMVKGLAAGAAAAAVIAVAAPFIGKIWHWAASRDEAPEHTVEREVDPRELLRTIATAHGLGADDLRAALRDGQTGAYLAGTRLPSWEFVSAFLDVIADQDEATRSELEDLFRPVWQAVEAAMGSGSPGPAEIQVTGRAGHWLTVTERTAAATEAVGRLERSAGQLSQRRDILADVLEQVTQPIPPPAAEPAQRDARRLAGTGEFRTQARERLAETERTLEDTVWQRDEVLALAEKFHAELANLEKRQPSPSAVTSGDGPVPDQRAGQSGPQLDERILHGTDGLLDEHRAVLADSAAIVDGLRQPHPPATPPRRRRRLVYLAPATAVVLAGGALGLTYALFPAKAAEPRCPAGFTSRLPPVPVRAHRLRSLPGGGYIPEAVAAKPGSDLMAIGETKGNHRGPGRIVLWKPGSSTEVDLTVPGGAGITSVAFSPSGNIFAAGDNDGRVYVWRSGFTSVSWLPDPRHSRVTSVAFGRHGAVLAAGDYVGQTYLWNLSTGTVVTEYPRLRSAAEGQSGASSFFNDGVTSVAFSPGGGQLAIGYGNGDVFRLDVSGRTLTSHFLYTKVDAAATVAFGCDGAVLAVATDDVALYSTATDRRIVQLNVDAAAATEAVTFRSGNSLAVGEDDGSTYLLNLATRQTALSTAQEPQGIDSVAFGPGGSVMVAGAHDGTTYSWRLTGRGGT